jgi:hypothetical protein
MVIIVIILGTFWNIGCPGDKNLWWIMSWEFVENFMNILLLMQLQSVVSLLLYSGASTGGKWTQLSSDLAQGGRIPPSRGREWEGGGEGGILRHSRWGGQTPLQLTSL